MMITDHYSIIPTKVRISSGWALTPEMPACGVPSKVILCWGPFAGMTEDML